MINRLLEGGNVFKSASGEPLTQRINRGDVAATVQWLEKITGLDLTGKEVDDSGVSVRWLGSTGRSASSGDVDLVVPSTEATKDQIAQLLTDYVKKQGLDPREWVKKAGEVHFRTPIAGDAKNGFVQTDFNFYSSPDLERWGSFYQSGTSEGYKGMYRNVLLSSIAKSLGYKVGLNGMLDRATNALVKGGLDPDHVAQVLLNPQATRRDLRTVESIYRALERDPRRDEKLGDFREYLVRAGLKEPTVVQENEVGFLARLRDRIVNQGMQIIAEADAEAAKKDPRIPHPEDAMFLGGIPAAAAALEDLKSAVSSAENITIKWDGKPALIFGRTPQGLAVMDKYMFDAGFAAHSPEDWMRWDQKKKSGTARTDLYPKLRAIWPGLDRAVKGKGFFWGDLMWAGELQPRGGVYQFKPNHVVYTVDANSALGQTIPGKTGGIVVHQWFPELGARTAQVWDGSGLDNVDGGVDIIKPNIGIKFSLKAPARALSAAQTALQRYGKAVDDLLNRLPTSTRQRLQTWFNQRIIGGTDQDLHEWLKTGVSAKQYVELVAGKPNEAGGYNAKTGNLPGALFTLDAKNRLQPSDAYTGLLEIWQAIYNVKLNLAQQLEAQVKGLGQQSGEHAEGEGFVVPTATGKLVKLVNRGVFSAGNRALNNPK